MTVEEIEDRDLLADDVWAAGTIPSRYVEAVAQARNGAAPVGLRGRYRADHVALAAYAEAARTEAGFRDHLDRWLADG